MHLGPAHQDGQGVAHDDVEARRLFQRACDGGDQPSCLRVH